MMSKKIAVVLSGCGFLDGAEINETVLALLAIEEAGCSYQAYAPDVDQYHVINHMAGEEASETRNVLVESSRIVRGNISSLDKLKPEDFDALILPGGYGVAKNLSDFAMRGKDLTINPELLSVCSRFCALKKPAGYICIAPVLLTTIYGNGVTCTIGNDKDTASIIDDTGGVHQTAAVDDIVIDADRKVVSTPAYMLANNLIEARTGIKKLVEAVVGMI